uniref:Putative von Willebrand factor type A domain protein n=1 Tax=uncultured bacterium 259 TaxID=698386 RepID=E3T6R4_9BACT|nr:putative von Willebrand factor type A domain protein [uncultured bacterium 259]
MTRLPIAAVTCAITAALLGPDPQAQTFRASVAGVSVTVAVHDGRRGVGGLRAEDFELRDNGAPQQITSLSIESTPIDLTLVLDTSSSMTGMMERLKGDVRAVEGLLDESDRAGLITFSSSVREVSPMHERGDPAPAAALAPAGSTAFYQAVVAALLSATTPGRPHLALVMSDGDDNISLLDGADVSDLARRSETVLYVVLRGTIRASGSRVGWLGFRGPGDLDVLKEAAAATGGELRREKLDLPVARLFKSVIDDFKASYVLRYTPEGVNPGGWHELTVGVKGRRVDVRARRGYFGG